MPRGRRGRRGLRFSRHVYVLDREKVKRVSDNIARKERLLAYLKTDPRLCVQLWHNPPIVDKLDANPALLDEFDENPEMRVPQFLLENPQPPPPPSKCCSII